jgi:hypothetical protein
MGMTGYRVGGGEVIDIDNYNRGRRHASPLHEHGGLVYGFWMVGNNYRNPTRYYGAYPPGYLEKMRLLFPEPFSSGRVLHLFSGMTEVLRPDIEITMDINPDLCPDIVGNAESLSDHADALVGTRLILADPPYADNHVKYGTEKVNKRAVVRECSRVLQPGGCLVWLDTSIPMWAKADGWALRGTIGLVQSTNHAVRVVTILEQTGGRVRE